MEAEGEAVRGDERRTVLQGALRYRVWNRPDDLVLLPERPAVLSDLRHPDLAGLLPHSPLTRADISQERLVHRDEGCRRQKLPVPRIFPAQNVPYPAQ